MKCRSILTACSLTWVVAACADPVDPATRLSPEDVSLAAAAPTITMYKLGTLGGVGEFASGLNNRGLVGGGAFLPPTSAFRHAFIWSPSGLTDLGTLGGSISRTTAINDAGAAIGVSNTASGAIHAFFWDARGGMVDIGTLGGPNSRTALNSINNAGVVVGYSNTATGQPTHVFRWTRLTGMEDLQVRAGQSFTVAYGINASGEIIGVTTPGPNEYHAAVYSDRSGLTDLGTLGGGYSEPWFINDRGDVAMTAETANGEVHAALWTRAGGLQDLGRFGFDQGELQGINNRREMILNGYDAALCGTAFFRSVEGVMHLLPGLGGCTLAYLMNDTGDVVGQTTDAFGVQWAVRWTVR